VLFQFIRRRGWLDTRSVWPLTVQTSKCYR